MSLIESSNNLPEDIKGAACTEGKNKTPWLLVLPSED